MATEFTTDVLVVGAGAAGMTLAIELARRGVDFLLVDKIDTPFGGSRGKGVQPRTLEIFEDLGLVDRMFAAGGPYPPQRVYDQEGGHTDSQAMDDQDATPSEPYLTSLMIAQFRTEALMRERLLELGRQPHYGRELKSLDQDETGVTALLATEQGDVSVRARYLIAADGGRSFIRESILQVGFSGNTLGLRAMVADVHLTGLGRDAWHRFGEGSMTGRISICPLMGTDMFQLQAPIPFEGEFDLSAEGLNAMVAERTGRTDIHISKVFWASAYNMNARLADNYRVGKVFLVGDAAHIHPPTGGQGLNTSVQDAYNLGWKLAAVLRGAPDALLDTYEEERQPIAAGMLGLATKLLDAAGRGDLRRGREVRQMDLTYAGSALAAIDPARTVGVIAGDRAPDAPVMGAAGQPTRLFNLFRGPHWTLLCPSGAPAPVQAREGLHIHHVGEHGDILDYQGHLAEAYGLSSGQSVLVRPDGYVGAIFSAESAPSIEAYLQKVGL